MTPDKAQNGAVQKQPDSLGKSTMIMASGTFVSRALGLVRNILLVAALGATGVAADAFDIANKVPNILFAIIAGGVLNAVIVPQVMRAYRSPNSQEYLDKLLTLAATFLLVLSLIATLGASVLVNIYASNDWSPEQTALAVAFAFWCIPQVFFYGLYTLLGQVLNARKQFGPYMWAPAVNNIISIVGFALFLVIFGSATSGQHSDLVSWSAGKIAFLGGTATLGVISQALILFIPLYRSGFRWNIRYGLHGIGLRSVGRMGLWTFLALGLDQIAVWVSTRIATAAPAAAPEGITVIAGNASYTQALMVYLLPHSLITVSIATALFTGMSAAAARGDIAQVRNLTSKGLRTIGVFTVFATAVFIVLAQPITKLLIPTLSPIEVKVVAYVLISMALGLVPLGAMVLMKWVYYAFEDGRSVFLFQIPVTIVVTGVAFLGYLTLPSNWWVVATGVAMSLSNYVAVALRVNGLSKRLEGVEIPRIIRLHVQLVVAASVAGVLGWFVLNTWGFVPEDSFVHAIIMTSVVGVFMLCIYVLALQMMKVRELQDLLDPILTKLLRSKRR